MAAVDHIENQLFSGLSFSYYMDLEVLAIKEFIRDIVLMS